MSLLRAVLGLAAALGLQVAVSKIWPDMGRFLSLLLVLVGLYGVSATQRSAMFVGCLAGLLHDVWLQAGAFGVTGFKWTLLGWGIGSLAMRLDLGHPPGRFGAGVALVLGDGVLNLILVRLLDQPLQTRGPSILVLQALVTGLLTAILGSMVEHGKETGPRRGATSWRSTM